MTVAGPPSESGEKGDGAASRRRSLALLALILFAATFPEVLSGSTPVPVLLSPAAILGYPMLVGLYGCGAVLVWEALVRWRKGWLSVIPFGAAYGIAEEGLGTKVMTDPYRQMVVTGVPGGYGHWLGVEWVSVVGFTIFHAAISIGFELLLVSLLFPELKERSLVTKRGLLAIAGVFSFTVGLMFFTVDKNPIIPLLPGILLLTAIGIILILVGRYLPDHLAILDGLSPVPSASPGKFVVVGFFWLIGWYAVFLFFCHAFLISAAIPIVLFGVLGAGGLYFLLSNAGWRDNRTHQLAFATGIAGAFGLVDVLLELSGDAGVLVFTAVLVCILAWLWREENERSLGKPQVGLPNSSQP